MFGLFFLKFIYMYQNFEYKLKFIYYIRISNINSVYKFRFAIENKIIFLNWFILVDLIQIIIAKIYLIILISYSFFYI